MRYISKDFNSPFSTLIPDTTAVASLNIMLANRGHTAMVAGRDGKIIESKLVNAEVYQAAKDTLKQQYHCKCAYCEAAEHDPEVEHYRPTRRVIKCTPKHIGYYWLVYEWSNIVPSCHDCNKVSGGKGDKFPIQGIRVSTPPEHSFLNGDLYRANHQLYTDEQPYLLHPELDSPEAYFTIHADGKLEGRDAQGRGRETIRICNLCRGNLLQARKAMVDDWVRQIREALNRFTNALTQNTSFARTQLDNDLALVFDLIRAEADVTRPYSFVAYYVYQNVAHFQEIVASQCPASDHNMLITAFGRYIAEHPL